MRTLLVCTSLLFLSLVQAQPDSEYFWSNAEGKCALVFQGEAVTGYDYSLIAPARNDAYDFNFGFYLGTTDSGKVILSDQGELIYPWSVDQVIWNMGEKDSYLIRKGDRFGFFSYECELCSPPLKYFNPGRSFGLDNGDNTAYYTKDQVFILEEAGVFGLVDVKQNEILPFEYDHIYSAYAAKDLMILVKGKEFQLYNSKKRKVKHEFEAEEWIKTAFADKKKLHGLVLKDGKVQGFDFKKGKMSSNVEGRWYRERKIISELSTDGEWIGFANNGKVLVPLGEYDMVIAYNSDHNEWFQVEKDQQVKMLDSTGASMTTYFQDIRWITHTDKHDYFVLKLGGLWGCAYWDNEKKQMEMLTDFAYNAVSHCVNEDCVLKGSRNEGYFYILEDGREVKQ